MLIVQLFKFPVKVWQTGLGIFFSFGRSSSFERSSVFTMGTSITGRSVSITENSFLGLAITASTAFCNSWGVRS